LPKNLLVIIVITIVVLVSTVTYFVLKSKKITYPDSIGLFINNQGYYLEVAKDTKSREIGLSNRDELCFNCGMLFVFDKENKYPFWMKNTHIPLDMIWLNSKYEIVKIINAAKVDSEDYYVNDKPAKYVIELNANETLKLGLKVGDTIQLPSF